jgi:6-phosphogluconolactonase
LAPIQTIACGNAPNEIVIDPFDRFAYVVNNTDGSVSEYAINPATGLLTLIGTVAADPSDEALSITLDSQGQNAYVTNYRAGTVWQYSINQTTGALTFMTSTPAGSNPSWLAIDPSGQYAYVTDRTITGSTIEQFSITNGALVPIGPVPSTGTQPVAIFTAP